MPHCVGLPSDPCPYKTKGSGVFFRYAELDFCSHCERARKEQDGVWVSESLIKETSEPQTDSASVAKSPGNHLNNQGLSSTPIVTSYSADMLLQPLLAYTLFSLQSGTADKVKQAVMGFFSDKLVSDAKDSLWNHCGSSLIGKKNIS